MPSWKIQFIAAFVSAGMLECSIRAAGQSAIDTADAIVVAWGVSQSRDIVVPPRIFNPIAVTGGNSHSVALKGDGSVVVWGDNSQGQANVPTSATNVIAISGGLYHTLALRRDGTVISWGKWYSADTFSTTAAPSNLNDAVAIAAGPSHDIALRSDGSVVTWPRNPWTEVPSDIKKNGRSVAAGDAFSAVLLKNGTVRVWGTDALCTNVPTKAVNIVAISAGSKHLLALKSDGTVIAWGAGTTRNGDPDLGQSIVPEALTNVVAISARGLTSMALLADSTTRYWGDPAVEPQNGVAATNVIALGAGLEHRLAIRKSRLLPILGIAPKPAIAKLGEAARFQSLGFSADGIKYQWQHNGSIIPGATNSTLSIPKVQNSHYGAYSVIASTAAGSVTNSATLSTLSPPVVVATTPSFTSTNWFYGFTNAFRLGVSAVATANETNAHPFTYCWTKNGKPIPSMYVTNSSTFQLPSSLMTIDDLTNGLGFTLTVTVANDAGATSQNIAFRPFLPGMVEGWGDNSELQLARPAGLTNVVGISAGAIHSLAVNDDGTVVQWGHSWGPKPASATNVIMVSAGYRHSLALRGDGTVIAWGERGTPANSAPSATDLTAIAAGEYHNIGISKSRGVITWGTNAWGLSKIPAAATRAIAVAAGASHSVVLTPKHTLVAWGNNSNGETNVPRNLTDVLAIGAGAHHSLALRGDGTVVAWGLNTSGQTSVPANLNNVLAIAAGATHSAALRNDGTVICWGGNSSGQTNTLTNLPDIRLLSCGGNFTLVQRFGPNNYPVDVTRDVLFVYNRNPINNNSIFVRDYYKAHRPKIAGLNEVAVACRASDFVMPAEFTNNILGPIMRWVKSNPAKHPYFIILSSDVPTWFIDADVCGGVSRALMAAIPGNSPIVTSLNFGGTNVSRAYIDKLESFGNRYSPGELFISASKGGYGNTNFVFDGIRFGDYGEYWRTVSNSVPWVANSGNTRIRWQFKDGVEFAPTHLTLGTNVAGYMSWGCHSMLNTNYATNAIRWTGQSSWAIVQTVESYNGRISRSNTGQYTSWFAPNSFGGSDFSNIPVGAVGYVNEPAADAVLADSGGYFGMWVRGKIFGICTKTGSPSEYIQGFGDPFTKW